jgi:type I restriction enzyme S subunit
MKLVPLREVCIFNPPKSEARDAINPTDLVSFMPMQDLGIESKNAETSSCKPLNEVIKGYTYFAENDVLIAKITPCFENGKMGIARNLVNGIGFGSSEYFVLRSTDSVLSDYLYYFLRQEFVIENGRGIMTGAVGHRRVPGEYLENLEIPLPSLEKQREIVEKLDSAFAEIDLLATNLGMGDEKANQLLQSLLSSSFSITADENDSINDSVDQSIATKLAPLGDVFTLEYGKPLDKDFRKEDGAFQAYGANGPISRSNKYLIEGPCVIVGRKGSAGEITFVEKNVWPLDVTYYIKHDPKESDLRYLYYILKSLNIKQFVRGVKPGLNRNDVYGLDIPFPSLEKQKEIVEKLDRSFIEIELLKAQIRNQKDYAVALCQSILSSAFTPEEAVA